MDRIIAAAKATYLFFSGDAITLTATLVAFALAWLLVALAGAPQGAVGVQLIVIIVAGLALTLWREIAGRPRART